MRNTITRKMVESTIHGFSIEMKDGTPDVKPLEPIKVFGKVTVQDASKILKKNYRAAENVTVSKVTTEEVQFEITVEDFVKYATRVEK